MQGGGINQPLSSASSVGDACVIAAGSRRLVVTGQIGMRADGALEKGLRAQLERAFANLIATCEEAGFVREDLVRITVMVTEPGRVQLYREVRERALGDHVCAGTYVQVAGLASPQILCELEAEAVSP